MKAFSSLLVALLTSVAASAAEPIPLRAGPLSMVFEPDLAFLRHLRLGPDEVLRGITAPVRDQFWATIKPQVKIVSLDQHGDRFTLKFDVTCREREIDFLWHGTISGQADGRVEYTFDGEARSTFKRNRIGFCILHGESAAGRPWLLETTSGEKVKGRFPEFIAPHQPAKDLRGIAHEFAEGRWAHLAFEGEIFEMEDQRNWTDASFKTYCTPLALPWGVEVKQGTRIQQKITLHLEGNIPKSNPEPAPGTAVTLTATQTEFALPGVGLRVSSEVEALSATELKRLKALHLDHLRVDLTPADPEFANHLRVATQQAKALGVKLLAALYVGKDPVSELKKLGAALDAVRPPVSHWLVIPADPTAGADPNGAALARAFLKARQGDALLGIGQDTNFTELNRNRPEPSGLDIVAYGMNPQVHAFDNASMIETLPIQADTVRSARQFTGQIPIIISPVTLRVQLVNQKPGPRELPSNVDPRQASLFGAGWTLGSLRWLTAAGVSRITYYETVGMKGLMASERPAEAGSTFPAAPGQLYPIYHLLNAIGEFAGGRARAIESSKSSAVTGLALTHGKRRRVLIANLTDQPQTVSLQGFSGKADVHLLGAGQGEAWRKSARDTALTKPLLLPPHGLARLDRIAD